MAFGGLIDEKIIQGSIPSPKIFNGRLTLEIKNKLTSLITLQWRGRASRRKISTADFIPYRDQGIKRRRQYSSVIVTMHNSRFHIKVRTGVQWSYEDTARMSKNHCV